jgi:hypothetical protein
LVATQNDIDLLNVIPNGAQFNYHNGQNNTSVYLKNADATLTSWDITRVSGDEFLFGAALYGVSYNGKAGTVGKYLTNDGTTASWEDIPSGIDPVLSSILFR